MYTVIVADDEEELRRALIKRVDWESVGFSVIGEAENGIEALELVEKLEPDLLLTDIQMPFINGIELARQVREICPTMHIAFLSGYDDFSYAQQAIQYNIISYILKPVSSMEMAEEMRKIKDKIDEHFREFSSQTQEHIEISSFLMPLLLDEFQPDATEEQNKKLLETATSCGLHSSGNQELLYTVMAVSIIDETGRNCTTANSANAIDLILRKYIKHASFYANGRVVSLLMATQRGFDKYLHVLSEDIVQSVKRIMGLSSSVGFSRVISKLTSCHEAYLEAVNSISYSEKNGAEVRFISDVERAYEFDQERAQNAVIKLENLIRGGSSQEMENWLFELFESFHKENASAAVISFIMVQLVSAVFRILYVVSDSEDVRGLQNKFHIQEQIFSDNAQNINEVNKKYLEFFMSARSLVSEQRKKSSKVICDKALDLIETQYMNPEISLVCVGNQINVSPNYLSSLIKKITKSTFIDLLTKKRIEIAIEYLCCTSMKIREISEKCGYNDQHYFSHCFKKVTGVSPNAYRRQNEEIGEQP